MQRIFQLRRSCGSPEPFFTSLKKEKMHAYEIKNLQSHLFLKVSNINILFEQFLTEKE